MKETMTIGNICNRTVVWVTEDTTIKQAAEVMRDRHVGSLVVVQQADAGLIVTGILTDRDIAIVAVARDFDPFTLKVADVMSAQPVTVGEEDSIVDAMAQMRNRGIRRVPVTTGTGVLVGIVTLDDLLDIVAQELQALVQVITSERRQEARTRP